MKKFLLAAILLSFGFSQARELTAEQKMLDFQQLIGQIKSNYGPLEYKAKVQNINVETLEKKYQPLIEGSKSNAEFYDLILQFNAEFRDSHFGVRIPSKKRASLGISTDLVMDKVLVADVDLKALPADKFNIKRGDQIISFDGKPTMDVVTDLAKRRGDGYYHSTLRIAAMYLTSRSAGQYAMPVGHATLEILSKDTGKMQTLEVPWVITGNDFDFQPDFQPMGTILNNDRLSYDNLSMIESFRKDLGPSIERSYMCSGTSRIERPKDAVVLSETPFVAYYYPTAKGNVGYVRIPHYMPVNASGPTTEDEAFSMYEYVISELESQTVGLIIDQDHNCGGSVTYLHRILSLFIQSPVEATQFRLVASKINILESIAEVEKMNPLSLAYKEGKEIVDIMKTSYSAGEYLTPKVSLTLNKMVYPNSVRYTKPVIMLIDELSGSGGDAFPSLMQGYGRAVLLGTRTMGAGGHVTEMPALNFSQISVNMTRSMFFRPDGVEVENNGAVPNIPYKITPEDFNGHYVPYREFYTAKLLELL
jgi:C-terminal processing protease CtpA/Prc